MTPDEERDIAKSVQAKLHALEALDLAPEAADLVAEIHSELKDYAEARGADLGEDVEFLKQRSGGGSKEEPEEA